MEAVTAALRQRIASVLALMRRIWSLRGLPLVRIEHTRLRPDRDGAKLAEIKLHNHAYRHLGLYAYKVKLLQEYVTWEQGNLEKLESLEQLRVLENGHRIAIAIAEANLPPGVDTQEDLDRLNLMSVSAFE